MTIPLITNAEIKEYVKVTTGVTKYDSRFQFFAETATQIIEDLLRRKLVFGEYTFFRDSIRNSYIPRCSMVYAYKPSTYIADPLTIDGNSSIVIKYDPFNEFTDDSIIDPSYYRISEDTGVITLRYATEEFSSSLKFTLSGGIVPTTGSDGLSTLSENAPSVLKTACLLQVQYMMKKGVDNENIGLQSMVGRDNMTMRLSRPGIVCQECLELILPKKKIFIC